MAATIIFDLGGVLVNLDWDKVCAPLTELSPQTYDEVATEIQNGPIVESSMLGHLTPQEFQETLCAKIQVNIGFDQFIGIWNRLLSEDETMASYVGELGLSHRLILASNTDAIHIAYSMEHFKVLGEFERLFLSNEMGLLKPDPDYFQHILGELQIDPAECIFIDDRFENVLSARSLGINGLVFESVEKLKDLSEIL
jgi:HAD superfamily hydrolase (TIGR01549 family)